MKKNILIVDDFEPNLLVLESLFEDLQVNILKATNGEDALRIVLKEQIDILLLDVKLPDIDGYEVGRLIRGQKKNKLTPIIFLSGLADQGYAEFIEKYPDNADFFQKPFDGDDVKNQVKHYIEKN
jgi:CheY-like chemotaxis protein